MGKVNYKLSILLSKNSNRLIYSYYNLINSVEDYDLLSSKIKNNTLFDEDKKSALDVAAILSLYKCSGIIKRIKDGTIKYNLGLGYIFNYYSYGLHEFVNDKNISKIGNPEEVRQVVMYQLSKDNEIFDRVLEHGWKYKYAPIIKYVLKTYFNLEYYIYHDNQMKNSNFYRAFDIDKAIEYSKIIGERYMTEIFKDYLHLVSLVHQEILTKEQRDRLLEGIKNTSYLSEIYTCIDPIYNERIRKKFNEEIKLELKRKVK